MKKVLLSLILAVCLFPILALAQTISQNSVEQAILNEMNVARRNPQIYIGYLEEYKKLFKGKIVQYPNGVRIQTIEGVVAVDEAINFLKTTPKLDAFKFSAWTCQTRQSATQRFDGK